MGLLFGMLLTYAGLLNPYATWRFLREEMGYKYPMVYYLAMIIDPLLRFNWIFCILFIEHSTVASFSISLTEILRRWLWAFIRMENEHCEKFASFLQTFFSVLWLIVCL